MNKAVIFIGIQASGKTTFYQRYYEDHVHISLDELRTRYQERRLLEECVKEKRDLVIDNTDLTKKDRKRYIPLLKENGYHITAVYFRSSVRESLERNSRRERQVPDLAIKGAAKRLEMPSYEEGFEKICYVSIQEDGFHIEEWREEDEL